MIVIADDDPRMRSLLRSTLTLGKYNIREAESGSALLQALEHETPELVLMDVQMPNMSGLEALKRLRVTIPAFELPVIMVSGLEDQDTILKSLDHGADDFIVKPFVPAILLAKVRAVLRGRRSRSAFGRTLLPGIVFDRRYEIKSELGQGGMAIVYRARDQTTNRDVALKVQNLKNKKAREYAQRFRREVEAMTRIDHEHVVRIYNAGSYRDQQYYTMELSPGLSLRGRLEVDSRLPPAESFRIVAQVAEGLHAVHQAGFIHRDVKPDNMFLSSKNTARIGDLGVVLPIAADQTRLTMDQALVGTTGYMAPEQLVGQDVGPESDIYSLGAVLFEVLTGTTMRDRDCSPAALLAQVIQSPRSPLSVDPVLPKVAETLCQKACAPEPENRFRSAAEFAQELWDASNRHG